MFEDKERPSRRSRVAIVEENNYHFETVFAFACSAGLPRGGCDLAVFAPDLRKPELSILRDSREFLREELQVACAWHAFPEFRKRARAPGDDPPFDLVIVNTFPPPGGRQAEEIAISAGRAVLGLVHDIHFFADSDGAQRALERYGNLWLAHAGVAAPMGARHLSAELQRRIVRFFPVFHFISPPGAEGDDNGRRRRERRGGVALPGMIEFARRDYLTALRLTAETRVPLKIFGGGSGWVWSDAERQRLSDEIAARGVPSGSVSVSTNISCRDFYRAVDSSRFVAVMTVNPEYLMGKLTGAVTAAVSCGVPMLARRDVYAHYTDADPAVFSGCMIPFDAQAPAGRGDDWGSLARDTPADLYEDLCDETARARETLLKENATVIQRVMATCWMV